MRRNVPHVGSSAGPSSKLVLAGRSLQLLDASIAGTISRTDVHTVIVGLSTPPAPVRSAPAKSAALRTPFHLSSPASSPASDPSTARGAAVQATFDQRVNTALDRFGDVTVRP